ncbi:EAL domain-containing protein [Hellea balneolensis]|uniref:EAL domain-containing protein n=1 Tax=Hellea balneolensis TaxID=287478 RepID=UPI000478FF33|nr:GGDEF domain-containing phosphodiesterase [Hellea balneolensis]
MATLIKVNQIGRAQGLQHTSKTLSLLGAASFLIKRQQFIWQDASLCRSLLRIRDENLPVSAQDFSLRLSPQDSRRRQEAFTHLSWDGAQYALRYQIKRDDARWLWVEERGERLSGKGETPHEVSAVIFNVQSIQEDRERAAYLAGHDDLTGLWNAARFNQGLTHIMEMAARHDARVLCLNISLSNLPDINETYGYDQGNRILKMVGAHLSRSVASPDITARISGRRFAVGLSGRALEEVETAAAALQASLSDNIYQSPHGPLTAEFESAVIVVPDASMTAEQFIMQTPLSLENEADKDSAINLKPQPEHTPSVISREDITADDILAALNDRRISLAFQPIIEAKSRKLHHYECLLRLRLEEGEVISAGRFIMAAERLGLVHLLDRRALELAAEALRQYSDIDIALNVSAVTLKETDRAAAYIAALKALGPEAHRVSLELTETAALEDPAKAGQFSVEARALGCKFAIDDFGSGYTTFQNLMAIEADIIKIDGSFIEDIARTPHKETFVRMMVDLAQTFGVKTVAEMVDNRADADLLERLGVDYLQGYMFGVPSAAPAWRHAS